MTLEEIAAAIRTLVSRARVVAEGAGAASLAAALAGRAATGAGGARVPLPDGTDRVRRLGRQPRSGQARDDLEGRLP